MNYGVTSEGFVLKPVDVILAEALERAKVWFGPDVDLNSTSPIRKILEVKAAEDGEHWKCMEDLYYGNFVTTAYGDNLDLLGEDLGLPRPLLASTGKVTVKLAGAVTGRRYLLPEGAILITTAATAFGTTAAVVLDAQRSSADVAVVAFDDGPRGDVPAGSIVAIDPAYAEAYLSDLDNATLTVTNAEPTSGGLLSVDDETYRGRLAGVARNLWTVDSIRQAVRGLRGVLDVLTSDPLGGVDVSQSYFDMFRFNDNRLFSSERRFGEPYFFDVVVAHEFRWPWRTIGAVTGMYERVKAAVDQVRPVGIHPNIVQADHIEVGVRAVVTVVPGVDSNGLLASIRARLARDIGGLRLGGDVLYSQTVRAFVEQAGVVDVQGLHLRRSPPAFGRITFGQVPQQTFEVEAAVGENLAIGPTELAIFPPGGETFDVTVVTR